MASTSHTAAIRRTTHAASAAALLLVLVPSAARAGGAVIEFERAWYLPGEVATGRVEFTEVEHTGTVDHGPYSAYLLSKPNAWLDAGPIPSHALPLGAVSISGPRSAWADGVATIRFVVPDIESGGYTVQICNAGCETSLADITFGWVEVYHTPYEASLSRRLERTRERVDTVRWQLRREARRRQSLVTRTERADAALRAMGRELSAAESRADVLERRVASLTRRSPLVEADPRAVWPVVVLLAAAVALLAFAASRRPRRRDFRTLLGTNVFPVILGGKRAWPKSAGSRTAIRRDVSRSSRVPISNATSGGTGSSDPTA